MRIFVTGATGFIGAAIARLGVEAHRGELADGDSLAAGARACDGVIHTAFIHDFSAYGAAAATDRGAVTALADALAGSGKPFVSTSGTALLAAGRTGTELDPPAADSAAGLRAAAEQIVLAAADRGVRSSIVRLPPSVHGTGDHAFVPALIDLARRTRVAAFVADGANRWPAVHRLDAARLFRRALERAAPGTRLHGVADEGVPMRAIAGVIGERLGVPLRGLDEAAAREHFGWLARFIALDNPTTSAQTRDSLDWHPQEPDLLTDMRDGSYFE